MLRLLVVDDEREDPTTRVHALSRLAEACFEAEARAMRRETEERRSEAEEAACAMARASELIEEFGGPDAERASRCLRLEKIQKALTAIASRARVRLPGWKRSWELLGYVFPKELRLEVYEPIRNELLEDYLTARRKYRTRWARRWLCFCYTLRTAWVVLDCFRVLAASKLGQALLTWMPEPLRRWWTS